MRFLYELAASIPALIAGATVGHVVDSLGVSTTWPQLAAVAVLLAAVYVLDGLISTLVAHRAANRG